MLLHMDTEPKFVELTKLVQSEVGTRSECLRPARLPLICREREQARAILAEAKAHRPHH